MPGPRTTLLVEGSFKELTEELAEYLDNLRKSHSDAETTLRTDVNAPLEKLGQAEEVKDEDATNSARDDVLKILVPASAILKSSPEKEFIAAYNLLIHVIQDSPNVREFIQPICRNLATDAGSPTATRIGLILSVLSTIFNVLRPDDDTRYPIFCAVLDVAARSSNYENLRPQLKYLDDWLVQWKVTPALQRRLYLRIASVARDSGEDEESYDYLIRALRTIHSEEAGGEEARKLSIAAIKTALNSPSHFDFEDLTSLDSVQALRNSESTFYEILEIFTSNVLDDFNDFKEEHGGWIEEQDLDDAVLVRKMRLLTLASLAAGTGQTRSLPYAKISEALQIPADEVEMWVIDVIRAGLVEGKLSQLNKTFLIHRSTYRVFTQTQWREVAGRLDMWRSSLTGVLEVIRAEKESMLVQREQELRAAEAKLNGVSGGGGYRRAAQRDTIDMGMD